MQRRASRLALVIACGACACATSTELGLLQHAPGDGTGGSLTGHFGLGAVQREVLAVSLDLRGDVATSGNRFAAGASVLGGVPIGPGELLARVGIWRAVTSSVVERAAVPTFELAGFVPLVHRDEPKHSMYGYSSAGLVFGVREDLDEVAYTTLFVGLALFFMPGY